MDCVNLKREFGNAYRVQYEESYRAEYGPNCRVEVPWLMITPCRNGHVYPWGGRELAASTDRLGSVARELRTLLFAKVIQDGSDGVTVLFDAEHLDEVAEVMKARRRRRFSPEEWAKSAQRLREYWSTKPKSERWQSSRTRSKAPT